MTPSALPVQPGLPDLPRLGPLQRSAASRLAFQWRPASEAAAGPRPLLVLLHGAGGDETSLLPLAQRLPAHLHLVLVRAPRRMPRGGFFWYPVHFQDGDAEIDLQQVEAARVRLMRFIDELQRRLRFDARQLYLLGFSQGGALASTCALTSPETVRGFGMLSGRLLSHLEPRPGEDQRLARLCVFLGHGRQDPVLPIAHAERAAQVLRRCGAQVSFHPYEGGHELSRPMFDDMAAWVGRQCLPPAGSVQPQP
ncbi:phospholipase [Aquabacterium sp. A7-Y]|uniref:alpha/beta hydrolase n=1 Tax=Aquabacterium sp. A7-Y TaxID=1349605 RepID=UPI00223D0F89|nr:phospholipase [Aquabacterium sp. A7-Y]MCW7540268.1 phospholipase [Aquabacterium sp. A7-Y]